MIDEKKLIEEMERWARANFSVLDDKYEYRLDGMIKAQDIVLAQPQVGGWIPVSERLPENECGVLVTIAVMMSGFLITVISLKQFVLM